MIPNVFLCKIGSVRLGDNCWEWTGSRNSRGYGKVRCGRSHFYVHRLMYAWYYHQWPVYEIDHLCSNRACCRPDHLEDVPHSVNLARGKGGPKAVCIRGHPKEPGKKCVICHREVVKRAYHRRRGDR